MGRDPGLDILLELNGTEYTEENGYWYRIEAWRVLPSAQIPHGVRYNLTLHDNHNKRIMGFDNAHAVKAGKRSSLNGRIVVYDHMHTSGSDRGTPYQFSSAQQLITDFFKEVNRILIEVNQ